jgi:hypothetical protein
MGEIDLTRVDPVLPAASLRLHPEWALEERAALDVAAWRSLTGTLSTVLWRRFASIRIPLARVAGADAARIAGWWRDGATVALTLDIARLRTTLICRFADGRLPLSRRQEAAEERWAGVIEFESVDEGFRRGRPFILDDPVYGRLDQSDLSLVP